MSEETLMPAAAKAPGKKDVKKQVSEKLAAALEEYKSSFDKKAFGNALKKTTRLFAGALLKKSKKIKPVVAPLKKKKEVSGKDKKSKPAKDKK